MQPQSCGMTEFFNSAFLQCSACGANQIRSSDGLQCVCKDGYTVTDVGSPIVECAACTGTVSQDKRRCLKCTSGNVCTCTADQTQVDSLDTVSCVTCPSNSVVNLDSATCVQCQETFYAATGTCHCPTAQLMGGLCFKEPSITEVLGTVPHSFWFQTYLDAGYLACTAYNNLTACQLLTNMVILSFNVLDSRAYNLYNKALATSVYLPRLVYNNPLVPLGQTAPRGLSFQRNAKINFKIAKYDASGHFLGWQDVTGGTLQLCSDTQKKLDAAYLFGTSYSQSCSVQISELLKQFPEPVFYELFLQYSDSQGNESLWPVPVMSSPGSSQVQQRFFLVDGLTGRQDNLNSQPQYVTYASKLVLSVYQPISSPGNEPPFKLTVQYTTVNINGQPNSQTQVAFAVTYSMNQDSKRTNTFIALAVLGGLSIFLAMLETSSWSHRAGQQFINCTTIIKYLAFLTGNVANTLFLITIGTGIYWLVAFKGQHTAVDVALPSPGGSLETDFIIYLSLAFAFKALQLIHMLVVQMTISIFLIDWERPKNTKHHAGSSSSAPSVSAWRTFFVANEWNEIQTTRKLNPLLQLFAVLLILEVIGVINIAVRDLNLAVQPGADNYQAPWSPILRYGITASVWLAVGIAQILFFVVIYERLVEDKIRQFVDLCSMSNVSVFILLHQCYGFYIHGRSVHGHADVSMETMHSNLQKEKDNLCALRGLEPSSEIQTFDFLLTQKFRDQLDKIVRPLSKTTMNGRGGSQGLLDQKTKTYYTMNRFLSSFLEHVHEDMDYMVKDKLFLEKIMNYEFQQPFERSMFYNDPDGIVFSSVLYYGNELVLLLFDTLLFCIIDLGTQNIVLATILTYLVQQLLEMLRYYIARNNLTKKTLVDQCFLI
ncbi:meckelin-like isoform X1 [Acipenser oxyrinchus oxyrinchus]|uniref:Meckelin-like isoform X1 n=1 Tax=Acipenser oxyrinchus oxyrinchus TaxID=40147 RepID=A0AAD8D6M7_ACIOX|nr:meckelin-like isoform X1 [Acipenser oxyrinchus oxyrinchus]